MRILIDYRPALRARTGVGEYVHEMARALVATAPPDESLLLFSSSWKDRLPRGRVPGAHEIDRHLPVRLLNLAWHRLGWPSLEQVAGAEIDVAQATHPLLLPARRAARLVTVYDLDFLDHPERTDREIRRDYPTLAGTHARQADHVIVISRHTAQAVEQRLSVPADRITICTPGAPDWARRSSEPAQGGCLLFLGTLEPRKNVHALLDAYEDLAGRWALVPPLVLAGRVTPDAAPVVARTTRAPLAGRIELPGYVSDPERRKLFDRALAFVMPSHTEGFGMPILEAMTAGVPVIAANRGALIEAVGPAGRLIDPDDRAAFSHALGEVLQNAQLRAHMSEAGVRHARQFRWTDSAIRMRQAWALALDRHRRTRG